MHEIRAARESDAAALAALARKTFRDAFAADNLPQEIERHCARSFGPDIQAGEIANPRMHTLVVDLDGALIGFGQLLRSAPHVAVGGGKAVEIRRLYVEREWHGRGIAQELMRVMLESAARDAADRVWLGVWERNARAIAFYAKSGFEVVGEQVFTLGGEPQRDLVMAASVNPEGKARHT